MSSAPLIYTLAQVKFNPIEQMVESVPQFQNLLRLNGYPDFRADSQVAWTLRQLDKGKQELKSQQNARWSFSNTQRMEGYLLSSDALTFHTTQYDSFADFSKKLIDGLGWLHETIGLSYIERIGLRYLNAIVPDNTKTLIDYLHPSLLGFSSIIEATLKHNFTEIMAEVANGTLVARAVIIEGGVAIPPDLAPLQLETQQKFSTLTGKTAMLDIDHFLNSRFDFDLQPVKDQLLKSNDAINNTFHAAITDHARDAWS